MFRRLIISVAALLTLTTLSLRAIERATFILTNGERKSGDVVFHTETRRNLIDGNLNLGVGNGKEETIPESQVAVIDFAGGAPAATELSQLPATGNFLVLRNGQSQDGTFVNLIGGDTLIWRNPSGQEQQYAIHDVSRVYLNPQSARTAFNYTGPSRAVGTSGTSAARSNGGALQVPANEAWTDTGIDVRQGDRYAIRASGQITFGKSDGQTATPDGNPGVHNPNYPDPKSPAGALIGKIGSGPAFGVGANQTIAMPGTGRLFLGVNDNELGDNGGAFSIVITRQ